MDNFLVIFNVCFSYVLVDLKGFCFLSIVHCGKVHHSDIEPVVQLQAIVSFFITLPINQHYVAKHQSMTLPLKALDTIGKYSK